MTGVSSGFGWRANLQRARDLAGVQGFPDVAAPVRAFGIADEIGYPVSQEALLLWTFGAAHQWFLMTQAE